MNIGVYQGAAAMSALERWQGLVSQNIASSSVPGYKKTEMSFEGVASGQFEGTQQVASMPVQNAEVSFANGHLQQTQNPTDLAMQGDGFFVLQDDAGQFVYTRDGEFRINAQNQLVNKNGMPVQGVGGSISVNPDGGDISVNSQGQVYQGAQLIDRIRVASFEDNSALMKIQGGFVKGNAVEKDGSSDSTVVQGFLEGSNVSSIDEMVNLIKVSRAQEANQKVIQAYDSRLSTVIKTFS